MKTWIHIIIFSLTSHCAFAMNKIAIVNISDIFQQSAQRAIIAKQLEEEFKDRAIELQSIEQNLQQKIHNLQRDSSTMRVSERNNLEKSIMDQREEFSNKAKSFQQDNQLRQTEERDKILNMIQKIVTNVAKREGYELVIDSSAIAYANNIQDITDDILKQVK
ncbi:OmpH family outer membrane protein [Blochmannia endosymbiont of Polyrhachis (Hedomyrma) turneri]|uniref:OmpH family outer membrane protein n=1 Tax=Blochmannia endosymbiont of Polyrhachis (Hedomyrma) turneri TaxID=1505596 RepID=UPI00061A6F5C|nr:OmpH family outer membrane protein [Blochmannia endosymbiont of Polyrhachis (Hedomyrma) turneri]AKC59857.1 Chaperone protein skp [Blochmannia endosymbiont of Polyrhachis (Hedomyrma) turneri]